MRLIIQRVKHAEVTIEGGKSESIGKGLMVLLGIEEQDDKADADWLAAKLTKLRIFPDEDDVLNLSVMDVGGEVMLVSQFTLHALTKKGNRPSYIKAAGPDIAIPLYEYFLEKLAELMKKRPARGEFGAMMDISLVNTGPVTIFMDSKNKE